MNTYHYPGKDDVEIIIGDEKQTEFFPRVKIKRWDNEVNFSVGIISTFRGSHNVVNDKVEWNDGHGIGARFYEKPFDEFEFEIILNERPSSGFILLSIETKGLRFLYQPELTQEEIDDEDMRPDNVVGSYAVYHESMKGDYLGGKNYRAGKFCHIYRPFVTDANGKREWCDLDITGAAMKITIPDGLVYPVIVDPTFGVDPASPGGTYSQTSGNDLFGSIFTSPADIESAQSVSVYAYHYSAAYVKGLIVLHSNLNIITNGIGSPAEVGTAAWCLSDFTTDPEPSQSTDYVLMLIFGSGGPTKYWDVGGADQGHVDTSNDYTTPTNPTDATHNNNEYSVYCTYTASAVIRELITTVATTTSTSASDLDVLRELAATIATTTALSVSELNVVRELAADMATTTAVNTIALDILRELISTISTETSTSDVSILALRELTAQISTELNTSDATMVVLRELVASIDTTTSLSDIELLITTLIELTTTIATTTSTSASEMKVLRELVSTIPTLSSTSDSDLNVLRELVTSIDTLTLLSDIELVITYLRELATTIATTTVTSTPEMNVVRELTATIPTTTSLSSAALNVIREFSSTISTETSTSDVSLAILRSLTTQIATGTDVSTAHMLVMRELSATVPATTLTSAIELIITISGNPYWYYEMLKRRN